MIRPGYGGPSRSFGSFSIRSGRRLLGAFDTLSMGMSGDFEIAIEEGSTLVRIGTALFGQRGQT